MHLLRRPASLSVLAAALVLGCLSARCPAADPVEVSGPPLKEGEVVRGRLAKGQASWTGVVEAPQDVTTLQVLLDSHQDLDLYLRKGRPVESDFAAEADARSNGDDGAEHVEVTPAAGSWYVTVAHPGAARGGASFTLVVLYESCGRPALLLEGASVAVDPTVEGRPYRFRTWFPPHAEALTIATCGRVTLLGPGSPKVESSSTSAPLVLRRSEGWPGGVYFGDVQAPGGSTLSVHLTRQNPASPEGMPLLVPGREEEFRLGGRDRPSKRTYRVVVPAGSPGFSVACATDDGGDFDLYARRGDPMTSDEDEAEYMATSSADPERLAVGGDGALPGGTYHVDVVTVDPDTAVAATLTLTLLASPGAAAPWGTKAPRALEPGTWMTGHLAATESCCSWFAVDVPKGARSMRAQVVGATAPVDVVLARRDTGAIVARSLTGRVDECFDASCGSGAGLEAPGRYALAVANRSLLEDEVDFRVAIAFDGSPTLPGDLRFPPFHDRATLTPIEAVAEAVVEISAEDGAGSGVCLTPGGLVLTCRHVLEREGDSKDIQVEGILVAFPDDFRRPPRQLYLAKLLEAYPDLDLALLQITGDVYGRPLPAGVRLPWAPVGDSDALHLGDPLMSLGYPETGSERSRTGIIVSRGIVSGFEATSAGTEWIKTDAWISHGNSGGAVIDPGHHLVGIAAAILGDQHPIGLVRPVSSLPAAWKALIDKHLKK